MKQIVLASQFSDTGAKDLCVSNLSLGIAKYGAYDKKEQNFAQIDRYVAQGGNFIDTALVYGQWIDETKTPYSEIIYGMWLEMGDNRAKTVTSTKGAHPVLGSFASRVTPENIAGDIAQSLYNLKTKQIDLYFLHRDDETVAVDVIMDELNRHAACGEINQLGASNWTAERIYRANDYCVKHHMRGFDVSQICFNLLRPSPKMLGDETLVSMNDAEEKIYRDLQMPIMAFTSQAGGFVSKFFGTPNAEIRSNYASEENLRRLDRIRILCRDTGMSPTEVTLGYLYGQALTVIPVTSVSNDAQLDDVVASSDAVLMPEQIAWIDG
ncbi:MAG: aldo/keto reductase [Clostridia bacterium]|nr:aldo/keto reductase [Clostridia bacterium]